MKSYLSKRSRRLGKTGKNTQIPALTLDFPLGGDLDVR